jgi:hypothetical protein
MATRGFLSITDWCGRKADLHTFHSGYLIPDLPRFAFDILAKHYDFFADPEASRVREILLHANVFDRLMYASGAASLLVAARPCVMEFVTPGIRKDIRDVGDIELSFSLQIRKSGLWVLRDRNGSVLNRFEVLYQMVERLTVKHTGD